MRMNRATQYPVHLNASVLYTPLARLNPIPITPAPSFSSVPSQSYKVLVVEISPYEMGRPSKTLVMHKGFGGSFHFVGEDFSSH